MNKKVIFVVLAVFLVVLIGGAVLVYDELYEDYTDSNGKIKIVDAVENSVTEKDNTKADTAEVQSSGDGKEPEENKSENAAPDVEFFDYDGNSVNLSDFFDKPVVLNFWASWCGPCKSEMPGFDRLYNEYKDRVHFIMLNVSDDRKTVSEFLDENGYGFPVYYDDTQVCSYVYGASSIPLTFVICAGGDVYGYQRGILPEEALGNAIKTVLGEE